MSTTPALKYITVPAAAKHTATIIFVHGLGDSGFGWQPVGEMFQRDKSMQHIKWVLPHATMQPVTANGGMVMPSWFDIYSFTKRDKEDEEGMKKSVSLLRELVDAEIAAGIKPERIVFGGFSQGAVLTLLAGLTTDMPAAGFIALSGRVPLQDKFKSMILPEALSKTFFWGHGEADPLMKYEFATESITLLKEAGVSVTGEVEGKGMTFKSYPGLEHSTDMGELRDLMTWIKKVIPQ
ncbi:Phospholipase/carboxylesterase [Dendrothele bispora CBS 962.96]|uniref:Acyl-protein thioesterase 1 n=1 Tax=Dendrothele bispora (strain CBS 962.96) TaxID=1314807 RepID=A0A4V4HAT2_DENBC|nr:Phospholipase/carboxylesterase [Dendrothele bispora CBS 962.96]